MGQTLFFSNENENDFRRKVEMKLLKNEKQAYRLKVYWLGGEVVLLLFFESYNMKIEL